MPVTARLSKLFYERLGEQIANELVDWFNAVDATYRSDLRELNETNFARFDAKLAQRLGQLETRLDTKWERRISDIRVEVLGEVGTMRAAVAGLKADIESLKAELVKWMFLFWAGTALAGWLLR